MTHRSTALAPATLLALALVVGLAPSASASRAWPGHPGRRIVLHLVRPGDTPSGLAVRYHAWTRELIALNGSTLYVGREVRVPVVLAAVRRAHAHRPVTGHHPVSRKHPVKRHAAAHARPSHRATVLRAHGWRHWRLSRAQVRALVVRMARRHGVPTRTALAVAWQESGWQQLRVSPAGALGIMQVLPDTGRWMSMYAGKPLNLRDSHGNVRAGVTLLSVLRNAEHGKRRVIGAYYQGLGAVRRHGLYRDTQRYVASVLAIERSLRQHGTP